MALAQLLVEQNFPAISIHRAMTQEERYVARGVTCIYELFMHIDVLTSHTLYPMFCETQVL